MGSQWKKIKRSVRNGSLVEDSELQKFERPATKSDHAKAFIAVYSSQYSDLTPGDNGVLESVVPFPDVSAFWLEYIVRPWVLNLIFSVYLNSSLNNTHIQADDANCDRDPRVEKMVEWIVEYAAEIHEKQQVAENIYDGGATSMERASKHVEKHGKRWLVNKDISEEDASYLVSGFEHSRINQNTIPKRSDIASSQTIFAAAFKSFGGKVRTMKCKGNFSTCKTCLIAADLLRNRHKKFSAQKRKIILLWRRQHLSQQKTARDELDANRIRARQLDPNTGEPTLALFFADAMTKDTTRSPKEGRGRVPRQAHGTNAFDLRIIGVEVVCGPIVGTFIYTTDNMVPSGANIMIEVMRQAQADLVKLLAHRNKKLPCKAIFQFDNGGENKVLLFC